MLNKEFRAWIQGYLELTKTPELTSHRLWVIKNHLNLVYEVEKYLDEDNLWLDKRIVDLASGDSILEPHKALLKAMKVRYRDVEI
jgi:hypothetical protein